MKYIILFLMEAFVVIPCGFFWIYAIDRYVNKHIRKNEMHKDLCDITHGIDFTATEGFFDLLMGKDEKDEECFCADRERKDDAHE